MIELSARPRRLVAFFVAVFCKSSYQFPWQQIGELAEHSGECKSLPCTFTAVEHLCKRRIGYSGNFYF